MSTRGKADDGVNRLLDIVVEEVSLVDRAANKHRFLIVKRSDDMDENTNGAAAATADETEDVQDLAAEVAVEETDGAGSTAGEPEGGSALAVALEALEGLTEAVELLGAATEDKARPRLAELAGELHNVSERLAGMAGAPPADTTEADAGGDGEKGTDADPLAEAIATVRATLGRVSALVATGTAKPEPSEDAAGRSAGEEVAAGEGSAATAPAQLGELTEALRTLTDTVREQQQRLARLEKRFGLPNSAPSGERRRPAEGDEDVSWPLDLNRGLDRENVDKAVSFHDV
ncbi:MAG: hypothetical protein ACOY3Y_13440 [Acidobacteriota bacterium]